MKLFKYVLLSLVLSAGNLWAAQTSIIDQNDNGILLKFKAHPLSDVLDRIHKSTGIQITYPEDLRGVNISVSITAPDWPSAMKQLLDGYNVMSMWKSDLQRSRIKVLGGGATITSGYTEKANPLPRLKVNGSSMQPALEHGDEVQIDRDYFKKHSPEKGDMIALKFNTRDRLMVKRILAVPGDRVEFKSNQMLINGKALTMTRSATSSRVLALQLKRYGNRIPKNNYIVMGDNKRNSFDSGDFGLVSKQQLEGKVIMQ